MGRKFEIKELVKYRPGVKQIDGSVVSRKPAQIALRTAGFDNLPKKCYKLQLKYRIRLNSSLAIYKICLIPLYCLLFIIRVGSIVTSPREPLPI